MKEENHYEWKETAFGLWRLEGKTCILADFRMQRGKVSIVETGRYQMRKMRPDHWNEVSVRTHPL